MDRHKQLRQDKSDKEVKIGLYEIDETIKYYFDNTIIPRITDGKGRQMKIPVVYGSPERWKSVQKSGIYRDSTGKAQFPAIVYKRTSVEKNRSLIKGCLKLSLLS